MHIMGREKLAWSRVLLSAPETRKQMEEVDEDFYTRNFMDQKGDLANSRG